MDGSRRPDAGGAPTAQVRPDPAAVAVRGAGTRTGTVPVPVPVRGGGAPRGDRRCVGTAASWKPTAGETSCSHFSDYYMHYRPSASDHKYVHMCHTLAQAQPRREGVAYFSSIYNHWTLPLEARCISPVSTSHLRTVLAWWCVHEGHHILL